MALGSVRDVARNRTGFSLTNLSIFTLVTFPIFYFFNAPRGLSQYVVTPIILSPAPRRKSFSVMVGPRETIL
jgi:hypothetical protein